MIFTSHLHSVLYIERETYSEIFSDNPTVSPSVVHTNGCESRTNFQECGNSIHFLNCYNDIYKKVHVTISNVCKTLV